MDDFKECENNGLNDDLVEDDSMINRLTQSFSFLIPSFVLDATTPKKRKVQEFDPDPKDSGQDLTMSSANVKGPTQSCQFTTASGSTSTQLPSVIASHPFETNEPPTISTHIDLCNDTASEASEKSVVSISTSGVSSLLPHTEHRDHLNRLNGPPMCSKPNSLSSWYFKHGFAEKRSHTNIYESRGKRQRLHTLHVQAESEPELPDRFNQLSNETQSFASSSLSNNFTCPTMSDLNLRYRSRPTASSWTSEARRIVEHMERTATPVTNAHKIPVPYIDQSLLREPPRTTAPYYSNSRRSRNIQQSNGPPIKDTPAVASRAHVFFEPHANIYAQIENQHPTNNSSNQERGGGKMRRERITYHESTALCGQDSAIPRTTSVPILGLHTSTSSINLKSIPLFVPSSSTNLAKTTSVVTPAQQLSRQPTVIVPTEKAKPITPLIQFNFTRPPSRPDISIRTCSRSSSPVVSVSKPNLAQQDTVILESESTSKLSSKDHQLPPLLECAEESSISVASSETSWLSSSMEASRSRPTLTDRCKHPVRERPSVWRCSTCLIENRMNLMTCPSCSTPRLRQARKSPISARNSGSSALTFSSKESSESSLRPSESQQSVVGHQDTTTTSSPYLTQNNTSTIASTNNELPVTSTESDNNYPPKPITIQPLTLTAPSNASFPVITQPVTNPTLSFPTVNVNPNSFVFSPQTSLPSATNPSVNITQTSSVLPQAIMPGPFALKCADIPASTVSASSSMFDIASSNSTVSFPPTKPSSSLSLPTLAVFPPPQIATLPASFPPSFGTPDAMSTSSPQAPSMDGFNFKSTAVDLPPPVCPGLKHPSVIPNTFNFGNKNLPNQHTFQFGGSQQPSQQTNLQSSVAVKRPRTKKTAKRTMPKPQQP